MLYAATPARYATCYWCHCCRFSLLPRHSYPMSPLPCLAIDGLPAITFCCCWLPPFAAIRPPHTIPADYYGAIACWYCCFRHYWRLLKVRRHTCCRCRLFTFRHVPQERYRRERLISVFVCFASYRAPFERIAWLRCCCHIDHAARCCRYADAASFSALPRYYCSLRRYFAAHCCCCCQRTRYDKRWPPYCCYAIAAYAAEIPAFFDQIVARPHGYAATRHVRLPGWLFHLFIIIIVFSCHYYADIYRQRTHIYVIIYRAYREKEKEYIWEKEECRSDEADVKYI